MTGSRVLQIMGIVLLALGTLGIAFQISSDANPVMLLGAVGPMVMGVALLTISRALGRER